MSICGVFVSGAEGASQESVKIEKLCFPRLLTRGAEKLLLFHG